MKHLSGWQLWPLFTYAELTEVIRRNYAVENLLKARFICESDENYLKMPCTCMERMNEL